ncbi:MAG: lytic transglycosylase domain-containing protein [Mangrovibacterium sp.]
MKKLFTNLLCIIGFLTIAVGIYAALGSNTIVTEQTDQQAQQIIFTPPPTPTQLTLFGERMPLEYPDVFESFDREVFTNSYYHSSTIRILKLVPRFFPIIKPILKEEGVPEDFIYLAVAESALNPIAISPAGAAGFWQFMKKTAPEYGLEVNAEIDERYHIEKATRAACLYFKKSYERLGNWTAVAATFNAGTSGVMREMNRQKQDNYYNLLLNSETSRYVFRIAALKLIIENPIRYGFYIPDHAKYKPWKTRTIKVSTSIPNFPDWCSEHNTNYKILKTLNPWLRDVKLDNASGKTYTIKLPAKGERI